MSVFTNPSSGAPAAAANYIQAVLDVVGSRDPIAVLESTPAALEAVVSEMSEAGMNMPEAPGKWSVGQVLRHLADSEIVWAFRLRMVLAEERPALAGYDQDAWAERLGYESAPPAESGAEFGILRRGNLRQLTEASKADLDRVGVHAERGEESLRHMIRLYAGHDLVHLRQIQRIRGAATAPE